MRRHGRSGAPAGRLSGLSAHRRPHLPGGARRPTPDARRPTPDALAAWVAEGEDEGRVVGHVALHHQTLPEVLAIACAALARPVDELGVVARLLVAPAARRRGVGRLLLDAATDGARARSRWPILDVCADFRSAVALYEARGWVRAGAVPLHLDDRDIEELVYLGPPPA